MVGQPEIEDLLKKQIAQEADLRQYDFGGASRDSIEKPRLDLNVSREDSNEQDWRDRWWSTDKYRHFLLSGFWAGFGYLLCNRHFEYPRGKSLVISGGVVFSFGLTKEIRDGLQPGNRFSYKDLVFDFAGVGCGLFIASR